MNAGHLSAQHPSSLAGRVPPPPFPAPLPTADSALNPCRAWADDGCLPLPDHFPEPHAHEGDSGQAMVYSSPGHAVNNSEDVHGVSHGVPLDEVKEGIRRIIDKYATPVGVLPNGSLPPGDLHSATSLCLPESCPASPSAFASPASPSFAYSPTSVKRVGQCGDSRNGAIMRDGGQCGQIQTMDGGPNHQVQGMQKGSVKRLAPLSVSAFSDVSSDMSDASPSPALTDSAYSSSVNGSRAGGGLGGAGGVGGGGGGGGRYQSVSGISLTTSLGDGVSEEDVQQVEMFYRSHKSEVTVCHSLANLYFGSATFCSSSPSVPGSTNLGGLSPDSGHGSNGGELWEFVTTGIPLLLLDSGEHHRSRQLSIVVAEKGTGFVLWKDVVSHLTGYTCPHANFHTLRISSDHNKLAGLSFDDSKAAANFAAAMMKLTSDPEDELLMLSKKGKKKKKKKQDVKKKVKVKPPKKTDISQPCCFQHVTKLERPQVTGFVPLSPNGFPPAPGGGEGGSTVNHLSEIFQERLSVSRARSQSSELSEGSVDHHR